MVCRTTLAVALIGLILTAPASAQWGTLTGQFILDGDVPSPPPIVVTKDQEICGKHNLVDESLVVNPDNKGIANIVLYLSLGRGDKAPKAHPDYATTADAKVRLDNKNCRYEPHVQLLRTSQTLLVGNLDPIGHNTKVDTVKNPNINPIIPANGEITQQFTKEENLPTKVSCSIHPWMIAYVVIKESPYMAVTDADGKFTIENLPEGKWEFRVWQEKVGYIQNVVVGGKKEKWDKGRLEVTVKGGDVDLGEIKVPAATFKSK
jgi:hypothetical protein